MGESAAGGGIAGIAFGVANTNERESGVEALRSLDHIPETDHRLPPERAYNTVGSDTPYVPAAPAGYGPLHKQGPYATPTPSANNLNPFDDENRQISATPSPGRLTPGLHPSQTSFPMHNYPSQDELRGGRSPYSDDPYNRVSTAWDPRVGRGDIDPDEIEDDGDDGMAPPVPHRRSILGLKMSSGSSPPSNGPPSGAPTATGGGTEGGRGRIFGALGNLVGRKSPAGDEGRDSSGQYGPVPRSGFDDAGVEKSDWLRRQTSGRSRLRWIVGVIIGIVIIGAITGGVIGGIKGARSNKSDSGSSPSSDSSGQGQSAQDDGRENGDLSKDSAEIKKLLGNPNLHKVFPGMAYTPFNAQYPACLTNPPSQNNVTRDMAVLSQLTNTVRLYGTDCNQTEMVLHAIDRLALTDMKVWLGVWLGRNATTNTRGISAMYDLIDKNGAGPFAGVIIGNEVLYRQDMTLAELVKILSDTRQNFTSKKIDLPIATSDLGDNWTADMVPEVDYVMANIHPFFAGVEVDVATAWTWTFWKTKDVILTQGTAKKNVISEVGWPSGGGRDCGGAGECTAAITSSSVAGIDEMNKFMGDFICQSLANGTNYFW